MSSDDAQLLEQTGGAAATGSSLPGHTVDDLRALGKAAEARAEFERLLLEGADSGIDPRPPATIFDAVRAEIRGRSIAEPGDASQTSDTAGAQE